MANQDHLEILQQGVETWNRWRQEYPKISPDLEGVELNGIHLNDINFSRTHLKRANLSRAELVRTTFESANLQNAILYKASLSGACFIGADLSEADGSWAAMHEADFQNAVFRSTDLHGAVLFRANLQNAAFSGGDLQKVDLQGANLTDAILLNVALDDASLIEANFLRANLVEANLQKANFTGANLQEADFHRALLGGTIFAQNDLRTVKGLETAIHHGPSTVDVKTVLLPKGRIQTHFLRGTGFPDTFIEYLPSLLTTPIQYYSCFISYSSKDEHFAHLLYNDLQNKGIRCWFAPEDLKIGAKIRTSIDESIYLHEKLLLVLSQHSITSQWVEQEVETALAKERKENHTILFPIRLDQAVMEFEKGWPMLIRNTRNIGDFTHWKQQEDYQKALERLFRSLKIEVIT